MFASGIGAAAALILAGGIVLGGAPHGTPVDGHATPVGSHAALPQPARVDATPRVVLTGCVDGLNC